MPAARFRSMRRLEDGGSDGDGLSDIRGIPAPPSTY